MSPGRRRRGPRVAAAAACVPLSLALGRRAGAAHLVAVASALSYNAGLKAGPLSFAPYAVSFGLLPDVVALAAPGGRAAPGWASAAGALLGVGAHLANALPDLEDDLATGVRGLPHRLGRAPGHRADGRAAAGGDRAAGARAGRPRAAPAGRRSSRRAGSRPAGCVLARRPGSRAAFLAAVAVAVVDVALLVARGAALTRG